AEVIDAKSPFTGNHSFNVALVAEAMARRLGLDEQDCRTVRWAGLVHDLGELSLSNTILDKPDRLSEGEWQLMRIHPRPTLEMGCCNLPGRELLTAWISRRGPRVLR